MPRADAGPRRLLWLAHATNTRWHLVLDDGAGEGGGCRGAFAASGCIVAVSGDFEAGDPIDLVGADLQPFARGLVSFGSDEIPALLGRGTKDLAAEFGEGYDREVVHRDDLILLTT